MTRDEFYKAINEYAKVCEDLHNYVETDLEDESSVADYLYDRAAQIHTNLMNFYDKTQRRGYCG